MKDFLNMVKKGKVYLFGNGEFKLNPIAQIPRGEATPQKMFSFSHEFENDW